MKQTSICTKPLFCCIAITFMFNLYTKGLKAQTLDPPLAEMYKVTQVSPDAASLGKYGEYPVGYYTGTPSINIPFYELTAGRIKVPIGLSYHAGGIKVEEIASTVGLGWSLNAGGVITRTVMGLPDEVSYEDAGSFINPTWTIQELLTAGTSGGTSLYNREKKMIAGRIDGQPDIFYFNFGNTSGKFMYHQEDEKFYSIPYSKMKIEFYDQASQSSFTLTDENGIQYLFEDKEYSVREREVAPLEVSVTTSWYLTSIYDPISKETVYFQYQDYTTSYTTMGVESHYVPITYSGESDYTPPSGAKQNPTLHLKKVSTISSSLATVSFDYGLSRCDLPGDYALTGIEVKNSNQLPIKTYALNYDYFISNGHSNINCNDAEEAVFKRLKLTEVNEDPNGAALKHTFEYNNTPLPSRLSRAQDHWGYYNGANSNLHLYPPYNLVLPWFTAYLEGGDRSVQPTYTKAGVLEKITYPTGGSTQFEFENNTAVSTQTALPSLTSGGSIHFFAGGEENYLEQTFTIFSGPCSQNNNQNGAYFTLDVSGIDEGLISLFGFPGISAQVKVIDMATMEEFIYYQKGGDKDVSNQSFMPTTHFLPNGDYKVIIDFSQNPFPETYMEANVHVSWVTCIPETNMGGSNRYVGGLRLKKQTSIPAIGATPLIKSYKYVQESNANQTSGQTHFYPQYFSFPLFKENFNTSSPGGNNYYLDPSTFLKRTSSSNYPLVSEHGKSVGYSNVIEYNGVDDSNGYTQYSYTNYSDYDDDRGTMGDGSYAHLPVSRQWLRGLELGKKIFKKNGSTLELVSQTINEYDTELLGNGKKTFEGLRGEFIYGLTGAPVEFPGEDMVFLGAVAPGITLFPTYSDFVYLKKTTERLYNGSNYIETVKNYDYNSRNLQPSIVRSIGSDGQEFGVVTKYPLDYTVTSSATPPKSQAIYTLQDMNNINVPIEKYAYKVLPNTDKLLTGASYYSYRPNEALVDTIFSYQLPSSPVVNYTGLTATASAFSKASAYKPEVVLDDYDNNMNLLQQHKTDSPPISYLYDYNNSYPVAEVTGAAQGDIAYTSFEDIGTGNWTYSGTISTDTTAPTGQKVYSLTTSKTLSKTGLSAGKTYVLSYWAKNSSSASISGTTGNVVDSRNGWTRYECLISGVTAITLSGTVALDEVRLYPQGAMMVTSTYEPLVGMTSHTDAKGMTTYYEYDGLNRLKTIKDRQGNILKTYDYHFKP